MNISPTRRRVARGAALLDREEPGWADRIDLGTLVMWDGAHCILGQLHGEYYRSPIRLNLDLGSGDRDRASRKYGFFAASLVSDPGWLKLDTAWTREVMNRKTQALAINDPQTEKESVNVG